MNIVQEKTGELTANLKIQLVEEDYQPKVEKALKDLQRKANVPGFRPGKVPIGMIKKMYGKSVLVEEVNKILVDSMYDYIKENNLNILGNPLPDNEKTRDIDWDTQKEFEFTYELGLSPEINLDLSDGIDVTYHKIKVDEKTLEETIEDIRKRNGNLINPEVSGEDDVLFGELAELDGDGNIIEEGLNNETNIYIQYMKDEEIKKALQEKKIDDTVDLDLVKAVDNETEMASMLGIKKEELENYSKNYRLTIKRISRMEPATLDAELFKKVSPETEIADEQAFRSFISDQIQKQYQADVDKNFKNDAIKAIVTRANLSLPEEFLKRWLVESNRENREITPEQVENEFVSFGDSFKWQLIENYLIKTHSIEVKPDEVNEYLRNYMRMQLRQYGQFDTDDAMLDSFVQRIASNKDELKKVYEQLFDVKILELFKQKLNLIEKEVTFEEFVNEMNEKYNTEKQTV